MNIMILGASGFIGRNLTAKLTANHQLFLVSRKLERLQKLQIAHPEISTITWDQLQNSPDLLKTVDVVINLCGQSILGLWTKSYQKKLFDSRIKPLQVLNELLLKINHKPHIISTSGVGAYGYQLPEEYQHAFIESDQAKHTSLLSDIAQQTERTLSDTLQQNTCHLRLGVVLSPKGGSFPLMKIPHYFGLGMVVGDGTQPFSWVSLTDVLGVIEHVIMHKQTGIYNVVSPAHDNNKSFNKELSQSLHRPLWLKLPLCIARFFGQMFIATIIQGQHVSSQKIQNTGYLFQTTNVKDIK
jgi:uncharacterized protein (TIGR01777 family)